LSRNSKPLHKHEPKEQDYGGAHNKAVEKKSLEPHSKPITDQYSDPAEPLDSKSYDHSDQTIQANVETLDDGQAQYDTESHQAQNPVSSWVLDEVILGLTTLSATMPADISVLAGDSQSEQDLLGRTGRAIDLPHDPKGDMKAMGANDQSLAPALDPNLGDPQVATIGADGIVDEKPLTNFAALKEGVGTDNGASTLDGTAGPSSETAPSKAPIQPLTPTLSDQMAMRSSGDNGTQIAPSSPTESSSSNISLRAQEATAQLGLSISKRLEAGQTRFQIELFPADLGKVDIDLVLSKTGQNQINLRFAEASSAQLFQGSEAQLQKALQGLGLDLGQASIRIEGGERLNSEAQNASDAQQARLAAHPSTAQQGFGQTGQNLDSSTRNADLVSGSDQAFDQSSGFDQPRQGSQDQEPQKPTHLVLGPDADLALGDETSNHMSLFSSDPRAATMAAQMFQGMNQRAQALFEAAHSGAGLSTNLYMKV